MLLLLPHSPPTVKTVDVGEVLFQVEEIVVSAAVVSRRIAFVLPIAL
jgi:hypothetical protein